MKKLLNILTTTIFLSSILFASSRGDVKVIEASENIRLLGQKIAKDYLYYYKNSKKKDLKDKLNQDIESLKQSILEIATITKNRDSKNILDFLAYNKDEIESLLKKDINRERAILMLDYGEIFLEGANSISNEHKYEFSTEEKMLMSFKSMEYLLERVSKYYIASALNLDKKNNYNSMEESIIDMDEILEKINSYSYPDSLLADVTSMNVTWDRYKKFLYKSEKLSIPNLLLSSETIMNKIIKKIALYHKQNL
jgi:hypothetical protein